MDTALTYLAIDRCHALARGRTLAGETAGAALFADISGFTVLTTRLVQALGPRRGAEALSQQLTLIYTALIDEVHALGGSVVGFAGDAITCWFDQDGGLRACAAALAMQRAVGRFASLPAPDGGALEIAVKLGVAVGPVRRFVAGDPAIQRLDTLAGATITRMARAQQLAEQGECLLDGVAAERLGPALTLAAWRLDAATGERYAVLSSLTTPPEPRPWPPLPPASLPEEELRPWLLKAVYERIRGGYDSFLGELRPIVSLFLRFEGLDYDHDPLAQPRLDEFVRWVQGVLQQYEAVLLALTIGDKGSYLSAAFGAPVAHENDVRRALSAALTLRTAPARFVWLSSVHIGLSEGVMHAGELGGVTRRTYSVLGDAMNSAARLMEHARPQEILVTASVRQGAGSGFYWTELPPLQLKGKRETLVPVRLDDTGDQPILRLYEPAYALPMVGREQELALVREKLALVLRGQGQVVGITGEAGIGKSRLLAEIIELAYDEGMAVYAGEAQSFGTNTAYLVWQPVWQAFFGVWQPALHAFTRGSEGRDALLAELEAELRAIDPQLVERLPLLSAVLHQPLPETALTRGLDVKLRQESLHALLLECLRARARQRPCLLVLEDCHWFDPLSHTLLIEIVQAIVGLRVLVLLSYRPLDLARLPEPHLGTFAHFAELRLRPLDVDETAQLIRLKLGSLMGRHATLDPAIVEALRERAQGTPFYLDQLLTYLYEQGVNLGQATELAELELPESMQRLILSRIDQLGEHEQMTLKVASVLGRLIRITWLAGFYPSLGGMGPIVAAIEASLQEGLVVPEPAEPDLAYLFKHMVTQEVLYRSLPSATRSQLHEQLARWLELQEEVSIDLLAYHYGQSGNLSKQVEYYRKAGDAAAGFAPATAATYYAQALTAQPDEPAELPARVRLYEKLGHVQEQLVRHQESAASFQAMIALAAQLGDASAEARGWTALSFVQDMLGDFQAVYESALRAEQLARAVGDEVLLSGALAQQAWPLVRRGALEAALPLAQQALALSTAHDVEGEIGRHCYLLGSVLGHLGRFVEAGSYAERALDCFRRLGDRRWESIAVNSLGNIAEGRGDLRAAARYFHEARELSHAIGDRTSELLMLINLAGARVQLGEYRAAEADLRQALDQVGQTGASIIYPWIYRYLAEALLGQGRGPEAWEAALLGLAHAQTTGEHEVQGLCWRVLGCVLSRWPELAADPAPDAATSFATSLQLFSQAQMEAEQARTLREWARADLAAGNQAAGRARWAEARALFERLDLAHELASMEDV